jgi:hypothetical protein
VYAKVCECAEDATRVSEAVALRQLAFHRIVMHYDNAPIVRRRVLELSGGTLNLSFVQRSNHANVAHVPGKGVTGDAVRREQTDEGRPRNPQNGLEIFIDELHVVRVTPGTVTNLEWSAPPFHIMIAGHDDRLADQLSVPNESAGALELARARPLCEIARYGDDGELFFLNHGLDRLDLLGDSRLPEVQI